MTRHLPFRLAAALMALAFPLLCWAQPGTRPAAPPSTADEESSGEPGYSYRSQGRRDPFVSLWKPGPVGTPARGKAEGLSNLYTSEVVLKGVLRSDGQFVAIVLGGDGKRQYIVHRGDRLADGVVKAITADSLVILQVVSDPLLLTKQREVRKTLRAVEEVK